MLFRNPGKTLLLTTYSHTHLIMWLAYALEQQVLYRHKEQCTNVGKCVEKSGISKLHSIQNHVLEGSLETKEKGTTFQWPNCPCHSRDDWSVITGPKCERKTFPTLVFSNLFKTTANILHKKNSHGAPQNKKFAKRNNLLVSIYYV